MKKRLLALCLTAVLSASIFGACAGSKEPAQTKTEEPVAEAPAGEDTSKKASDVKLTFMTNVVGEQAEVLEAVIQEFAEQSGYEIEYSAPGGSYEELMKTKMSANEMPDLFTTHGWSVMRYGEYLEPVNNQPFAEKIVPQMKPVITDKDGSIYVLPIDADIAGIVYNVDVLEQAGVNVDDLKTWDDFSAACEKIKASGVTPLHVGGKDNWTIGQLGDWIGPSFFVTNDQNNQREALKSGKFDAATWEKVAGLIDSWVKAGFFNEDSMTADYNADAEAMGKGETAFCFYGNNFIVDSRKVNPEAKLGMMPIPAASAEDTPSLIAGERLAVGVWKDSSNKEAAFELLNFLAQEDSVKRIATSSGNPAGLIGVNSDIGDVQNYIDKYKDIRSFPYFDREYLPSGMWDVMCATGADILAQKPDAVTNAGKVMEQNFTDKFV